MGVPPPNPPAGVSISFPTPVWGSPNPPSPPQTLQKELQGHEPRVEELLGRRGEAGGRLQELRDAWKELRLQAELRRQRLESAHAAQLFYCDAAEAEAWMGEQELHMMAHEKAKVPRRAASQPCAASLHRSPVLYPCIASLYGIPSLHPFTASLHCIPVWHPFTASLHCIPALHPCAASLHCIPVRHP